jgi:hypothetical protein
MLEATEAWVVGNHAASCETIPREKGYPISFDSLLASANINLLYSRSGFFQLEWQGEQGGPTVIKIVSNSRKLLSYSSK